MIGLADQQAIRMADDSSEKIDTTEKAEEDGSEKVDATENADAAEEETPDMGMQPETQNDENNPAPSNSTDSLFKSGSDPVAETEKKEEDDGAQENFSSSSGSMKVDVQGDSHSTLKLSTPSDGEKKGSISGSEKRDERDDQAFASRSSSTLKRVAFDEPTEKMSEVYEESQSPSEDQGSLQKQISSQTIETRDSTTMTTLDSEPNYSEYSSFAEHLADYSMCSDSMYSREGSVDVKPQRGSSAERYTQQAHELVNMVIENASKHLVKEQLRRQTTMDELEVELSRGSTPVASRPVYDNEVIENIDWLTIEEFTVNRGTFKIEEFIKVRIWSSVFVM